MATVKVEPAGVHLEVKAGETVFQAAVRRGVRWPNVCGGNGLCRTCWFEIVEGEENLAPVEEREAAALRLLAPTLGPARPVRLACQARICGDVTVRKPGVRPCQN
jgi:2Fe-2S ferredoxin